MYAIAQITSDPLQRQTLNLANGKTLQLQLYFRSMQLGWFINELVYGNNEFVLRGMRICVNPNMLNQWRNQIPFGLACFATANREPSLIEDFQSGASKLYILTTAEVQEWAEYLANGPA